MGQKVNPNGLRVGVIKNWDGSLRTMCSATSSWKTTRSVRI